MKLSGARRVTKLLVLTTLSCLGGSTAHSGYAEDQVSRFMADLWVDGADAMRILWRDCSKKLTDAREAADMKEYFPKFVKCIKKKSLKALDRSLSTDVVPLTEGINLVRYEIVDRSGKVMHSSENDTNYNGWSEEELETGSWRYLALERMAKILRTHVIKLDLDEDVSSPEKVEFRHRRRQQMMTMMMFGIISMGMVLVPMGFQFLAVLGGKALLLAKMALILSSIQGLKKVVPSPVNYGYYNSYPHPYEHFDKRSYSDEFPEPATLPAGVPQGNHWGNSGKTENTFMEARTWRPELPKQVKNTQETRNPRMYPVYPAESSSEAASSFFGVIDSPSFISDPTTTPGEVHAEYSVDLPINKIHFQSPTTVVSA